MEYAIGKLDSDNFKVFIIAFQKNSCHWNVCLIINKDRPIINCFKDTVGVPIGFGIGVIYRSKLIKVMSINLLDAGTIGGCRIFVEEKGVVPVPFNALKAMLHKIADCVLVIPWLTEISRIAGERCLYAFNQLCQCLLRAMFDVEAS